MCLVCAVHCPVYQTTLLVLDILLWKSLRSVHCLFFWLIIICVYIDMFRGSADLRQLRRLFPNLSVLGDFSKGIWQWNYPSTQFSISRLGMPANPHQSALFDCHKIVVIIMCLLPMWYIIVLVIFAVQEVDAEAMLYHFPFTSLHTHAQSALHSAVCVLVML